MKLFRKLMFICQSGIIANSFILALAYVGIFNNWVANWSIQLCMIFGFVFVISFILNLVFILASPEDVKIEKDEKS